VQRRERRQVPSLAQTVGPREGRAPGEGEVQAASCQPLPGAVMAAVEVVEDAKAAKPTEAAEAAAPTPPTPPTGLP